MTEFKTMLQMGNTKAVMAAANPIPAIRQMVVETDTGQAKVGDGITAYNSLRYVGEAPYIRLASRATSGSDVTAILPGILTECVTTGATLDVSGGEWIYSGPGISLPDAFLSIRGATDGSLSRITITSDAFLIDTPNMLRVLDFSNFDVSGGKGFIRQTYTGSDVGATRTFRSVRVMNFTKSAIAIAASDSPSWRFEGCYFDAASSTGTIGLVLPNGLANEWSFKDCIFADAQVMLKVVCPNDVHFDGCAFYHDAAADAGVKRVHIWMLPVTDAGRYYGQTMKITVCKFGAENWSAEDYKIVIADAVAGAHLDALPNLTTASAGGRIDGFYMTGCKLAWSSTAHGPVVFSTSATIFKQGSIFGNTYAGGATDNSIVDIPTIKFLAALGVADVFNEFISMKGAEGTARMGIGGVSQLAASTWSDLTPVRDRYGVGSPEAVVPARVGTRYIDLAATGGVVEWLKQSGTTTSLGWRAVTLT